MTSTLNTAPPDGRQYVSVLDLGGGLNTKKDPHALTRSELAVSVNCWYGTGSSVSKRPGNAAFVTSSGATGVGTGGQGLVAARFGNKSTIVVQQGTTLSAASVGDTAFVNIGTLANSPGSIRAAQMFDPDAPTASAADGTLFIVDGVESPRVWKGPGNTITAADTSAGHIPQRFTDSNPITPKYVATLGYHLFYAGEPTYPSAVYISDPDYPNRFQSNSQQASPYPGSYFPYIIGQGDGVNGGDITGIEPLGSMMLAYKQAAIYRGIQVGLYGDLVWKWEIVSASVGCVAPRSLVRFDTFHVFLGIDGVYMTDGQTTQCISSAIPTFFDSSLTGNAAIITNRTTAVGVRHGNRYELFFEDAATGYPTRGMWFDFNKPDTNESSISGGLVPTTGEIQGMKVNGAVCLRGPKDDGNVVWVDGAADRVAKFGVGFGDFGAGTQSTFYTKADFFAEEFGNEAPIWTKQIQTLQLLVSVPQQVVTASLTFLFTIVSDLLNSSAFAASPIVVAPPAGGQWGNNWGTMVWSGGSGNTQYQVVKIPAPSTAFGKVLQFGFQETSIYPWTIIGYTTELNARREAS